MKMRLGASSRDPTLLRTPLLAVGAVTQRRVNIGSSLSPEQFAEAQFYLSHYGNAEMHVAFLIRHGFFERAYAVVVERKMPAQAFVDTVFVPLLRHGLADDFCAFIKRTDPKLQSWLPYLAVACRFLSSKHNNRLLLDLQLLMGDFFRAGLSCISFACQTALTLPQRLGHLDDARNYFEKGSNNPDLVLHEGGNNDGHRLLMSQREIQKHLDSISLQAEVFQFFDSEANASGVDKKLHLKAVQCMYTSLFAGDEQQLKIACDILVVGSNVEASFGLAFRIIAVFLNAGTEVYKTALCELARLGGHVGKIAEVLKFVKPAVDDVAWDEIVLALVNVLRSELNDVKLADQYSQVLKSDANKIEALIACGRLKNAYLIAVKTSTAVAYVKRIRQASMATEGNHVITSLCVGFLKEHGEE